MTEVRDHMLAHGMDVKEFDGAPKPPVLASADEFLTMTGRVSQTFDAMEEARKAYERARSEHATAVGRLARAAAEIAARQGL